MAAGAENGGAAAFGNVIGQMEAAQQRGLQQQAQMNELQEKFQSESAGLEMANAVTNKMASMASRLAQQVGQG